MTGFKMIGKRNDNNRQYTVGVVETAFHSFAEPGYELRLESGDNLGPITQAYETYGRLNSDKSNAILVCHALSGDAHAAGVHEGQNNIGWRDAGAAVGCVLSGDGKVRYPYSYNNETFPPADRL